jgi:1,2-dihydroxy-3-keto-5-methylthiopentene dioxygenase
MDVVRIERGAPDTEPIRKKFLDEHRHGEDEVRFFVEGRGAFYLHLNGRVYRVVCTKGDLISVPAGTKHWFDMGADPEFTAIRLFNNPDGWIAAFTGDPIASNFPKLD